MNGPGSRTARRNWSKRKGPLAPIALMTFGELALLVILAMFLTHRFDETAFTRERVMVEQGFTRQVEQYELLITPQAIWDRAIARLDHTFDPDFADRNFGSQLYTFNGFTRTFMVDGDDRLIYASIDGARTATPNAAAYRRAIADLLPVIRAAERQRGPVRQRKTRGPLPRAIQASEVTQAAGGVFIVIATLIEPDEGLIVPKGPRAPVVYTLMPINRAALDSFAARYMLDNFHLVSRPPPSGDKAYFLLRDTRGQPVAALAWTPRRPGTILLKAMKLSLLAGLLGVCLAALVLIRRSLIVVDQLISSEAQQHIVEERLAAQEERSRLNRITLLEAMSSSIAHEVNQPIGAALNYVQAARNWLSHPLPDIAEARNAIAGAVAEISKAGHLISTIRQLTRRHPRRFQNTDLSQLIMAQVDVLKSEFERRGVALAVVTAADGSLNKVSVCRTDIAQVLLNLLSNALESFTSAAPGRQVTVELVRDDAGWAEIRVIDNGCGIPADHMDKIFNTFFTTKAGGTGLGLAICAEIAEHHSGSLLVSTNASGGTTAILRLPPQGPVPA